ncbi:MAG: carboxypeptidase-like regulatory domain-containing protein, partial [Vicinamibacteraceae bacterium]
MTPRSVVAFLGAILCILGTAFAQDPRGSIRGRVTDPSGAFLPGATVFVVNVTTGIRVAAQANQEGMYSIPFLPPGSYNVHA